MGRMKREMLDREDHGLRAARLVDLLNQGTGVSCSCTRCGHRAEAATAVLVAQLGPDYPVPEIGARMRCGACGSKDVATRPAPVAEPLAAEPWVAEPWVAEPGVAEPWVAEPWSAGRPASRGAAG